MVQSVRMTPLLEGVGWELIASGKELIGDLVAGFGSPFHLVFPDEFARRVDEFQSVFTELGIAGRIFYASKANKSEAFLHAASRCKIGVDVASREELLAALASGIAGRSLMFTGPDKGRSAHRLALIHGACIAVDSVQELKALLEVLPGYGRADARVILRFRPDCERDSRFGLPEEDLLVALDILAEESDFVHLDGFSIHLNGYDVQARARAGAELVHLVGVARAKGLQPSMIDLGGGWPVSYVRKESWRDFQEALPRVRFHAGRKLSEFYPYYQPLARDESLRECFATMLESGQTLAQLCRRNNLTVAIEPGRALLDQAGVTVFRIKSRTDRRDDRYSVLTVDGQSFSLSEQWFGSEFLPDPILLGGDDRRPELTRACVAGSSCLDSDMITWRAVEFDRSPGVDDLLVYPNTAGYQMDSNESNFHRVQLPKKVAIWKQDGRLRWTKDQLFHHTNWLPPTGGAYRNKYHDNRENDPADRAHASS